MPARKDVHIGPEIERVVRERGITISCFAELIHCNRSNVYDLFKRKSIDIDTLIRISEVLDYDFIKEVYYPASDSRNIDIHLTVRLLDGNAEDVTAKLCCEKSNTSV